MRTKLVQCKTELKALAEKIRSLKAQRKSLPHGVVPGLFYNQEIYRHKHVAYCLTRGTPIEKIESKVREGNELSQTLLEKFLKELEDEALCAS